MSTNSNDKNENNNPEKQRDPASVPRFGRFFLHDDREKGRGQRNMNWQRKPRESTRSNADGGFEWKHDKFEQLVATEERPVNKKNANTPKPVTQVPVVPAVEENRYNKPVESKQVNSQRRRKNPNETSRPQKPRPPRTETHKTNQNAEELSNIDISAENSENEEQEQEQRIHVAAPIEQPLVEHVSTLQLEQVTKAQQITSPSAEKAVLNPSAREFQPIVSPTVDYRNHSNNTMVQISERESAYLQSLPAYDPSSPYYDPGSVQATAQANTTSYLVQSPYGVDASYLDQTTMMHSMYTAAAAAAANSMMLYDPTTAAMYYTAPDGTILWYAPASTSSVPTTSMMSSTMDMTYYPYPTDPTTTYMPPPAPIPTTMHNQMSTNGMSTNGMSTNGMSTANSISDHQ